MNALAVLWRYVRDVMGDTHYERYLAHHRAHHPGTPVLSEREYWAQRHADADARPGSRCC